MLSFLLFVALVGAVVVCAALGSALFVVLRREADLVIKVVDRLEAEANGLQDQSNDQARRLTRRRTPIVPPQRKAS